MPSLPPSPRSWRPERALVLLVAPVALAAAGCGTLIDPGVSGSGTITESVRDVESFTVLEANGAFEVSLATGDAVEVVIRADDNLQERITTQVADDRLVLGLAGPVRNATLEADVTVPADALRAVELTGASSLTATDELQTAAFGIVATGASRVFLVLAAEQVQGEISGASVVNLTGSADALDVDVSGASSAQLSGFAVTTAQVDASGASRASVAVSEALRAVASGASTIRYVGEPEDVESSASSGSTIGPESSATSG